MATPNTKIDKNKTTVKIGDYKHGKTTRTVYSRMLKTVATKLGVTGKDDGIATVKTVTKGAAKGSKYPSVALGGSSEQYVLYFGKQRTTVVQGKKTIGVYYRKIVLPVPAGTPLSVVAAFAKKLKVVPSKIGTPTGKVHFFQRFKPK